MPDTRPITDSFPWLAIGRHRPVFDNNNRFPILVSDDQVFVLTDDSGQVVLTPDTFNPGDLYRYI